MRRLTTGTTAGTIKCRRKSIHNKRWMGDVPNGAPKTKEAREVRSLAPTPGATAQGRRKEAAGKQLTSDTQETLKAGTTRGTRPDSFWEQKNKNNSRGCWQRRRISFPAGSLSPQASTHVSTARARAGLGGKLNPSELSTVGRVKLKKHGLVGIQSFILRLVGSYLPCLAYTICWLHIAAFLSSCPSSQVRLKAMAPPLSTRVSSGHIATRYRRACWIWIC